MLLVELIEYAVAVEIYELNIKEGPTHLCYSCDRLLFKTQVYKITRNKLKENHHCTEEFINKLLVKVFVKENDFQFCSTCLKYIKQKNFPRLNINNSNLEFPVIPEEA